MRVGGSGQPQHPWQSLWRQLSLRVQFTAWFLRRLAEFYGDPFSVRSARVQVAGDRIGADVGKHLEFEPQPRVKWADPLVLLRTWRSIRRSAAFDTASDQRRSQPDGAKPWTGLANRDGALVDFVADTGDGFPATYTVAYMASREMLCVGGEHTQRGDLLVFGGDLVYPIPSRDGYDNRLLGPFKAALPSGDQRYAVLAIPANHDWYDNLNWFSYWFLQPGAVDRGPGARAAAELLRRPAPRWMVAHRRGLALDTDLDEKQARFIVSVGKKMVPGEGVVLVVAKPAWLADAGSKAVTNQQTIENMLPSRGQARPHRRLPPLRALRQPQRLPDTDHVWRRRRLHVGHPPPPREPSTACWCRRDSNQAGAARTSLCGSAP